MAGVQGEDVHASFLFVGDLNDHQRKWLGSTTTNRHGVAEFNFVTVIGWGANHSGGGTLDLLMTDDADLVLVVFVTHR